MRITPLTDHVTQLTRLGLMNAYLVREDDGLTLVDTMSRGSARALRSAAEELDAPIRRIVLTHGHADHVGSVDALREALGDDVALLAPARDARIMAGDKRMDEGERRLRGGWPKVHARPDATLEPGGRVGSLEVVAAPGHTPGQVALLDTRDRVLLCGDAFHAMGGLAVCGQMTWSFPLVALATWDPALSVATARALTELRPSVLCPGHGRALRDPQTEMEAAVTAAERAR